MKYTNGFQNVMMSRKALGFNRLKSCKRKWGNGRPLPVKALKWFNFHFQKYLENVRVVVPDNKEMTVSLFSSDRSDINLFLIC